MSNRRNSGTAGTHAERLSGEPVSASASQQRPSVRTQDLLFYERLVHKILPVTALAIGEHHGIKGIEL